MILSELLSVIFLEDGFVRVIAGGTTYRLEDEGSTLIDYCKNCLSKSEESIEEIQKDLDLISSERVGIEKSLHDISEKIDQTKKFFNTSL